MMRSLPRRVAFATALLLGAGPASGVAAGAEPVRLANRVEFAPSAGVTEAVRDQCGLQTSLPAALQAAASEVELVPPPAGGARVLTLSISEVHALGGGPFSGPKWIVVAAELREGGHSYTARAKRVTSGAFPGGTCGQLQKVVRAIAGDLAAWLAHPSSGAELGDAR
jgi:hypothetical protein